RARRRELLVPPELVPCREARRGRERRHGVPAVDLAERRELAREDALDLEPPELAEPPQPVRDHRRARLLPKRRTPDRREGLEEPRAPGREDAQPVGARPVEVDRLQERPEPRELAVGR